MNGDFLFPAARGSTAETCREYSDNLHVFLHVLVTAEKRNFPCVLQERYGGGKCCLLTVLQEIMVEKRTERNDGSTVPVAGKWSRKTWGRGEQEGMFMAGWREGVLKAEEKTEESAQH